MARFNKLGQAIGIAISKDEQGIRNLLQRNGVSTANIKTKNQLADVFVESLVASKGLAQDFSNYVKSKDNVNFMYNNAHGMYNNAGGMYNNMTLEMSSFASVVGDGVPDAYNMTGDESNTNIWSPSGTSTSVNADGENEEEKKKGGFFEGITLKEILNQAKDIYLADKNDSIARQETEQIKTIANTQINNDNFSPNRTSPEKKSNTGLYIFLGVLGLAVVGGVIYFVSKKK